MADKWNLNFSDTEIKERMKQDADVQLRRRKEFELRVAGLSYRDIYEEMKKDISLFLPTSFSLDMVKMDVYREIENVKTQIKDYAFEVYEIDLARLENLMLVYYDKALNGDERSANLTLRIMERRSRMLGLDSARKVEVKDWRSEIIDLYNKGKLSRDQIEKELGNELARQVFESGVVEHPENREVEDAGEGDIIEGKLA